MKKNIFSMGLMAAAALTLTTNCAKTEADFNQAEGAPFELIATSAETKVANDGMATKWSANDQINVFYAEAGSTTYTSAGKFTTATGGSSVTFNGTISGTLNDNNDWYAFYPYDSNLTTPKNTTRYCSVGGNQTQGETATATAHLAGSKFPLYGNAKNVAKGTTPTIEMKQAMSVVKVHVTNNSGMGLLVNTVTFSTEDYTIGGQYYIDFSGDTPVFEEKSGSVNKSVTLTVTNGKALVNGASADFYIGIVPFVAASGKKMTVKVNDYSKEITLASQATFESGKIKTLNFNYDHVATPASLPFSIDGTGGRAAYSSTDGLSSYGLGSDYAAKNHSPYLVKFDGTGDYVQVYFDKQAAKVGFGVKMIGGNATTHIDVTGSSDGLSFTQIQRFTISGNQNDVLNFETTEDIDAAYRFIRLVFDKGTSGSNVGLGPVSISVPSTAPVINASNITGVAVTGTTTTFAYTINNFAAADDVSVKEVDGTVVTSAVVTAPGTVSYTVSPNYGTGSANGSITLTSVNEGIDKVVSVTQVGETFSTNAPSTITLAKNSGTDSFTITTPSYGWASTVTPEDGMNLTISPTSGDANSNAQTITINSTTAATANEQTLGTIVIYRNGNSSDPQKKTIVVKKAANAVGTSWVETALADLTSSDEFVIVGNGRSMSNGNGTANPPSAAAVTVSNGVITSTVTDAITWTLQGNSTDGYTFYPKGVTNKWLYCNTTASSSSNNNMRIGTGTRKVFVLENYGGKSYLVTKDSNTKRYVCVYNNSDWRGYVQSSVSNNVTDTKFYKKVTE